jgi:hypothetical protein
LFVVIFTGLFFNGQQAFASERDGDICAEGQQVSSYTAPEFVPYVRQYDLSKRLDRVLSKRRTVNVFLPWNGDQYFQENSYGLHWEGHKINSTFDNSASLFLKSSNWTYDYPDDPVSGHWFNRILQESFIIQDDWRHADEYGQTLSMAYYDPGFPEALAAEATEIKEHGLDGIMLDWWHNNHPNDIGKEAIGEARVNIARDVRKVAGDDFIILGNTNWNAGLETHDYINGVFLELYKGKHSDGTFNTGAYSCRQISQIESLLKLHENHLQYPKIIALEPWRITMDNNAQDRVKHRNVDYAGLFTAMLSVLTEHGYVLYADNNSDLIEGDHHHFFYDVYNVDLGRPVSKGVNIARGAAYKKYEKGVILYNARAAEIIVNLRGYEPIVIPALSGLFLQDKKRSSELNP